VADLSVVSTSTPLYRLAFPLAHPSSFLLSHGASIWKPKEVSITSAASPRTILRLSIGSTSVVSTSTPLYRLAFPLAHPSSFSITDSPAAATKVMCGTLDVDTTDKSATIRDPRYMSLSDSAPRACSHMVPPSGSRRRCLSRQPQVQGRWTRSDNLLCHGRLLKG
jgi:hypothetical protein